MSTIRFRYLFLALGVLSLVVLICLFISIGRSNRYRADVKYAHDIVWSFQADRDLALKAEVPEAVRYLEKLHFPEGKPSPFSGSLSNYVEEQRRIAVRDVITCLRAKTGKELGNTPEAWIAEYGNR